MYLYSWNVQTEWWWLMFTFWIFHDGYLSTGCCLYCYGLMIHKGLSDIIFASATCILIPELCWVCPATVQMAALIVMQWSSAAFVYGFALLINMQTGGMWMRGWIVPLLLRDTGCFLHRDCLSLTSLLPLKSGPLSSLRTASVTLSPRGLHSHIHLISDLWLSLMSSSD